MVNTEFQECLNCTGIETCHYIEDELKRFSDHVSERKLMFTGKQINYVEFYQFYLCESNEKIVSDLRTKNIFRALEICLLLEFSQSSTEQMFSQINIFLRANSSIETMDAGLAAKNIQMSWVIENR